MRASPSPQNCCFGLKLMTLIFYERDCQSVPNTSAETQNRREDKSYWAKPVRQSARPNGSSQSCCCCCRVVVVFGVNEHLWRSWMWFICKYVTLHGCKVNRNVLICSKKPRVLSSHASRFFVRPFVQSKFGFGHKRTSLWRNLEAANGPNHRFSSVTRRQKRDVSLGSDETGVWFRRAGLAQAAQVAASTARAVTWLNESTACQVKFARGGGGGMWRHVACWQEPRQGHLTYLLLPCCVAALATLGIRTVADYQNRLSPRWTPSSQSPRCNGTPMFTAALLRRLLVWSWVWGRINSSAH